MSRGHSRDDGRGGLWGEALCWVLLWLPLGWGMGMLACTRTWGYAVGLALAFAALAAVSVRAGGRRGRSMARMPAFWWVSLGMVAWVCARATWAPVPLAARWDALKWVAVAGMGWAWVQASRERGAWRILLCGVFLLVALEFLYGVMQHANGSDKVLWMTRAAQYGARTSGTYLCPNHFANVAAMTVPMAVATLLCAGAGLPLKVLAGYALLAALPGLYWSESRSAWLGTLGGLATALLAWAWRKNRGWFFIGLVAVPLLAAGLGVLAWKTLPAVRTRVDLVLDNQGGDFGSGGRLNMWRDAWAMWKERPADGHGGGSFEWVFPAHQRRARLNYLYDYPHNEWLGLLAEYGAVGAGALGLAGLAWLFETLWALRAGRRGDEAGPLPPPGADGACGGALLAGAAGAMAATAIHATFDFNFHIFPNPHVWAAFTGIAWGAWISEREALPSGATPERLRRPVRRWIRRAAGWALAAAWVACGVWAVRGGVSYWLWLKGEMAYEELEWETAENRFRRAVAWDGDNASPWTGLGDVYYARAFWYRDPGGDVEATARGKEELVRRAEDAYRAALERNPMHPMAVYGIGKTADLRGDPERALGLYKQAADMRPFDAFHKNNVARRLRQLGRKDEAKAWLEERNALGKEDVGK